MGKKRGNYRRPLLEVLLGQQSGICALCEKLLTLEEAEVDHIFPQSVGGSDSRDNCQAVHGVCNKRKGNSIWDRHSADDVFGREELKECPFYKHYRETCGPTLAPIDHVAAEGLRRLLFVCDQPEGMRYLGKGTQTWFWESENWMKVFDVPLPVGDVDLRPGIGVGIHFFRADGMEQTPAIVICKREGGFIAQCMLSVFAVVISEKNEHYVLGVDVAKEKETGKSEMLLYRVDDPEDPESKVLKDLLVKMTVFLEYKVVDTEEKKAQRGFRRRIEKGSAQEADVNRTRVNVVRWRRRVRGTEGEGNRLGKDFYWEVVGHMRRQYYPSTGKHHAIWIDGHLKGNLEGPIKKSITINRVDR